MKRLTLAAITFVLLPFLISCSSSGSSANSSSAFAIWNGLTPDSTSSPYFLTIGSNSQAANFYPYQGAFVINGSPSINALADSEPYYEIAIGTSPCTTALPCASSSSRLYIAIECPGFIGNPAGCEAAAAHIDIANPPSGVTVIVNLQSVGSGFYNGSPVGGTLSVIRSASTPAPAYVSGMSDTGSKFDVTLTGLSFNVSNLPNTSVTLSSFVGEVWGPQLMK